MKKRKTETMMMFHIRIPVDLHARLATLAGQVAGATVVGLGRELLERAVAQAEKDPKRELIRDAS